MADGETNPLELESIDRDLYMEGGTKRSHKTKNKHDDVSSHLPITNGLSAKALTQTFDRSQFRIHKAVYENDIKTVIAHVKRKDTDLSRQDMHGNTALHLSAMLGRKECIQVLLAHDAPVNVKNLQGQTPLNEAISYGDRNIITTILHRLRQQTQEQIEAHQPDVERALTQIDDFEMKLKWEFHSWVPLVSRFLPSDVCHIYKKGCKIRMDTTLVDFKDMKWERGDLSFLFDGQKLGSQSLLVMDNTAKVYQWIRDQSEEVLDSDVDIMMGTDNETGKMSTRDITFTRAHTGIIFKENKTEMIGGCKANFYNIHGIKVNSIKRREHLTEEDIKQNKTRLDHNNIHKTLSDGPEIEPRQSLLPPPKNSIPWEDYWSAPPGQPPCIGRPISSKSYSKSFQASVAMSEEFPVTVDQLITVLESIKPLRHFKKLREFLECKLPPGFPVKLEIPVFPTVAAKVSFEHFAWRNDLDSKFFEIPPNYKEDAQRFNGL